MNIWLWIFGVMTGMALLGVGGEVPVSGPMALVEVPVMVSGEVPAAGKRVRGELPEFAGTDVHHSIYLPADFDVSKKWGLIVEFTGNFFPRSGSTGEVSGANLGFSVTLGKGFVWVVLPFVSENGKRNEITWWGSEEKTVSYAKACVRRAMAEFNIDPKRVVLCGFSRGAVGVGYIGLRDDEIAGLWSAFLTHDGFDGATEWKKTMWGSPLEMYRKGAVERLKRLKGRPFWVGQYSGTEKIEAFLKEAGLMNEARFRFGTVPVREIFPGFPFGVVKSPHTDLWALYPSESADRVREWLRVEVPVGR